MQVSNWNHGKFEYYAYQLHNNFEAEITISSLTTQAEKKWSCLSKQKRVPKD